MTVGRRELVAGRVTRRATHRRRVHRLLGVVFVVLGYVLVAHGLMALGVQIPHPMPHIISRSGAKWGTNRAEYSHTR